MKCGWDELLQLVPLRFRKEIDGYGRETMQELRLRLGQAVQLQLGTESISLNYRVTADDIGFVINAATHYSPWSMQTAVQGYLTAKGGHRIGICGIGSERNAAITKPTMLNIRVARSFPGISSPLDALHGNVLIIGPPGCGKTTVLRDYITQLSSRGFRVSVADERQELFPVSGSGFCFDPGENTDVLQCIPKPDAALMLLRTMNPQILAMDELTDEQDAGALRKCFRCGTDIIATAHAGSVDDFMSRHGYLQLQEIFHQFAVMDSTQHLHLERL